MTDSKKECRALVTSASGFAIPIAIPDPTRISAAKFVFLSMAAWLRQTKFFKRPLFPKYRIIYKKSNSGYVVEKRAFIFFWLRGDGRTYSDNMSYCEPASAQIAMKDQIAKDRATKEAKLRRKLKAKELSKKTYYYDASGEMCGEPEVKIEHSNS